jgi:hypothetical protein
VSPLQLAAGAETGKVSWSVMSALQDANTFLRRISSPETNEPSPRPSSLPAFLGKAFSKSNSSSNLMSPKKKTSSWTT